MELTKEHFDKVVRGLATKEELKVVAKNQENFVTKTEFKKELSKLATKEDLKNLATKEEQKTLATKDELKKLATKDELKPLATKSELKILENKIDKIGITLDGIAKDLQDSRDEKTVTNYRLDRDEKFIRKLASNANLKLDW